MPKRKRRDKQSTSPRTPAPAGASSAAAAHVAGDAGAGAEPTTPPARPIPVDPAVALFAQRHRDGIEREKQQQRERTAERQRLGEHDRLVAAKDAAVATMKRLGRSTSATQEERDAADAAYRTATADLIAHETGARPTWAPAPEVTDEDLAAVEVGESHPDGEAHADGEAPADGEASEDEAPASPEDDATE